MPPQLKKLIKKMASIKMAVVVISAIATLTAVGTFVEARYDAQAAQKLVYQSLWMQLIMGFFCLNLIAVIVDRYPWKVRHLSFIFAHIGILFLVSGQWVSNNFGLDGSVRVGVGESNRFVTVNSKTDLSLWSSFDGSNYSKLYDQEVDFFLKPPTAEKPILLNADQGVIKVTDYQKYVIPTQKVTESLQDKAGSGLRFQIHNERVNVVEWVVQRTPLVIATHDFGPAKINLGPIPAQGLGANEIYLEPVISKDPKTESFLKYAVFKKESSKPFLTGKVLEGGAIATGWMGLELKVLRFMPRAEQTWELTPRDRPTPLTTSAAQVEFQGQKQWVLMNDTLKLFTEKAVYILSYANRRIDLGFPIQLNSFTVDRYQGTARAAAYKSQVEVPDVGSAEISMNEPLKYRGLTIYQASFEDGMKGPTASIFSVNQDPGRPLKYLGSLIMTLGIILLFYFRKKAQVSAKKSEAST